MNLAYSKLEENQGYLDREITAVGQGASRREAISCKLWPWIAALATLMTVSILSVTQMKRDIIRPDLGQVISCYYNTPSGDGSAQLQPSGIGPRLCTHINVAFARIVNKSIHLEHSQYDALQQVVKLKQNNPMLKVLLSVGGAGENNGFSEMVINHASRKIFIKSIKKVLKDYSLDGIDLDWEFPVVHDQRELSARERQHFSQLLREIRLEYIREKRDYILSVALAAPQSIVDVAYDVDQINLYVDFANIMTYDFHYYTKFTPFTGFNSPLYARSSEELFLATLNINYTVHMYQSKGLDRNKIVVGIPTYGHSFNLVNPENPSVGSPASGIGALGAGGFVDYPTVCAYTAAHARGATLRWDEQARAPYLYCGAEQGTPVPINLQECRQGTPVPINLQECRQGTPVPINLQECRQGTPVPINLQECRQSTPVPINLQECRQGTPVPINLQNIQKDGSVDMSHAKLHHKQSDM
ncbi:Cht11 [Operophtera brumata]|uniref:Cht11 n=1 Tax=Operophtera brumata TaxID=104452 RepID=A0A0L7KVP9_OPEBR|nr:Cht11 [Operophtera brumata]